MRRAVVERDVAAPDCHDASDNGGPETRASPGARVVGAREPVEGQGHEGLVHAARGVGDSQEHVGLASDEREIDEPGLPSPLKAGRFQVVVLACILAAGVLTSETLTRLSGTVAQRPADETGS